MNFNVGQKAVARNTCDERINIPGKEYQVSDITDGKVQITGEIYDSWYYFTDAAAYFMFEALPTANCQPKRSEIAADQERQNRLGIAERVLSATLVAKAKQKKRMLYDFEISELVDQAVEVANKLSFIIK